MAAGALKAGYSEVPSSNSSSSSSSARRFEEDDDDDENGHAVTVAGPHEVSGDYDANLQVRPLPRLEMFRVTRRFPHIQAPQTPTATPTCRCAYCPAWKCTMVPHIQAPQTPTATQAAYLHVLTDLIQSIAVAFAGLVLWAKPHWQIVDPICTFVFSLLVLSYTIPLVQRITHVLMEGKPEHVRGVCVALSPITPIALPPVPPFHRSAVRSFPLSFVFCIHHSYVHLSRCSVRLIGAAWSGGCKPSPAWSTYTTCTCGAYHPPPSP